ncbi:MAG: SUMF1/EgtB/PvdO family nonheme iron enzyme [Deltaproteobacteria bacterium]|nr:SUMF1/EgtB/PvdO family nonheme iron enzyme [Deltaproteobacteria bacterium]
MFRWSICLGLSVVFGLVLWGCSPKSRTESCSTDQECPDGQVCDITSGKCVDCLPDCKGKCCGDDGCGASCPDRCSDTGQTCNTVSCECEGECVPNCTGKDCGPDGCLGECEPGCDDTEFCNAGTCQLLGCSSNADCQAPTPFCQTASRTCVECLEDNHCAGGLICSGGVCADRPVCETDGQCEIGEICVEGDCLTGCRSNRDCPGEQRCVEEIGPNGTCVECELTEECPPGTICQDYHCVSHCTEHAHCTPRFCNTTTNECVDCTEDAHCDDDSGLICEADLCIEGCRTDDDCPGGTCDQIAHQCIECEAKDDCPLGNLCIEHQCVQGCEDNRDCPGELLCDNDMGEHGACVECEQDNDCDDLSYVCLEGLCVFFCQSDDDCFDPQPACDTLGGVCVACVTNDHCSAGTICVDLACVPGCQIDDDCPTGMVCDTELGLHGGCVDCKVNSDCPNGFICENNSCVIEGSQMIRIPGGTFVMGSDSDEGDTDERPERIVSLPTYYIDTTEVSNEHYRACVQAHACTEPADLTAYNSPDKADHPVVYVNWDQAYDFCSWMGKSLPTEARWERAARGPQPDERTYPWGNSEPNCSRANFSGCLGDTAEVGSYPQGAAPSGALDMAGNVYEWVYDRYDSSYYSAQDNTDDPFGPSEGDNRSRRGGGWDSLPEYIRCANRAYKAQTDASANVGFRCAMRGSPSASFTVAPEEGPYATTNFSVDASGSTDPNHPQDSLEVHWDWEDDGVYDTSWTTAKTDVHRYAFHGIFRIKLQVRDPDGNTSSTTDKVAAIGSTGWDGDSCESNQECAYGFACIAHGYLPTEYFCREECIPFLETCWFSGQTCSIAFDIDSQLYFACKPE